MRRPVIAGNWKMYKTQAEARAYFAALKPLVAARDALRNRRRAAVHGAGGCGGSRRGFGDLRSPRRMSIGQRKAHSPAKFRRGCWSRPAAASVIIAHSERRQFFGETDETANRKVKAALAAGSDADLVRGRDAGRARSGSNARGAGAAVSRLAGRVDRCGVLAYHRRLRAGVGHRDGPHGDPGNCGRSASVPAGTRGGSCLPRSAPRTCGSSTAAASSPTTSRG